MGGRSIFVTELTDKNRLVIFETLTATRLPLRHGAALPARDRHHRHSRVLLVDGEPMPYALARMPSAEDNRGNLAAGAQASVGRSNDRDRWLAAQIGPALAQPRHAVRGLDVIGGYVTEINVTSPTGIRELDKQFHINIGDALDAGHRASAETLMAPMRALVPREGSAPVRDRLLMTLFIAALIHGMLDPRAHLCRHSGGHDSEPAAWTCCSTSDELPTAARNDSAAYLAQRTQLGPATRQRRSSRVTRPPHASPPAHAGDRRRVPV